MVKYCPKCGTPNEDDALFCKKCGYKFMPSSNKFEHKKVYSSQNEAKDVILSSQGYEHLITLLKNERKNALWGGIVSIVFGIVVIVFAVTFWVFAVSLNYQAYSDSDLINGFIYVLLALGIILLSEGISNLIKFKRWEGN